ncbi:hypothetical protein NLI96_g1134 [Meripilus lineatus]|uniref:Arrestin-like N-terminal domain-containing protein n=1 Tax=Meripilus lineatus TaxID=2056292 RepID=A0AAD5YIQ7_9APHY|nr:hypothetical protein NLI96_g1134 [Physisporinus lineatus]
MSLLAQPGPNGAEFVYEEPPEYAQVVTRAHPIQTEHAYQLSKRSKYRLSLALTSRARDAREQPHFVQRDEIMGSVELTLNHEEVIRSVTISVIGDLFLRTEATRFLSIVQQLHASDAREVSPSSILSPVIRSGKLKGQHTWSFRIQLPKGVVFSEERNRYQLPPSLCDTGTRARVQYSIVVRMKRGIWSSGQRLAIPFEYTPLTRPSLPSIMRQISYMEQRPLIGPDEDSDGWKSLPAVNIYGKAFSVQLVEVTVTLLSILKYTGGLTRRSYQLSYTRGSIIPLSLSMSASDQQVLDLLSAPSTPQVHLVRKATVIPHMGVPTARALLPWDSNVETVGTAIWWRTPHPGSVERSRRRHLQGEIRVPKDLPPNCSILNFSIEYQITFETLKAVAFSITSKIPPTIEPVEITTTTPQAPLPVGLLVTPTILGDRSEIV